MSLEIHIEPKNNSFPDELRKGYRINAALVAGLTALSAGVNRAIGNGAVIGSKASADGVSLLSNYMYASLQNNISKGNIRNVASQKEQIAVLAALAGGSAAIDALIGAISGKNLISETTAIAVANIIAHLVKISCYNIVGKKSFIYGPEAEAPTLTPNQRRALNGAVTFMVTLAAATAGNYIVPGSGMSAILYNLYSTAYRKLGKAGLQITEEKCGRMGVVLAHAIAAIGASAIAGATQPLQSVATGVEYAWDLAKHYLGPTSAIAITGLLTDQLMRAKQKWKAPGEHTPPEFKGKKSAIHGSIFTMENIAAAAGYGLNSVYGAKSKTVDLGVKLWEQGLTFHTLRESLKGAAGKTKALILAGSATVTGATQLIANRIMGESSTSIFSVAFGNICAFTGKWIRNELLPKPH